MDVYLHRAFCLGLGSWSLGPDLQGPRLKIQFPNFVAIRYKSTEAWNMGQDSWFSAHAGTTRMERGKSTCVQRVHVGMGHATRALILGPRGSIQEPKGEEACCLSLGPCGHDYYDYWGKGGKANKKGPRSLNLGPRGFSICLLDMRHTHSQSSDHNVC